MKVKTNECVECGLPCLGVDCPNRNTYRYYCDECGEEGVDYEIEGEELCEECAEKNLNELLLQLSIEEKAEAIGIYIYKL